MKLAKVVALRFGVVFLALFALPFPLSVIPKAGAWIDEHVSDAWNWLDVRVGDLFGLEVARHPTGSGDTLADYVHLALLVALALAVAAAWTLLDRNRRLDHPAPGCSPTTADRHDACFLGRRRQSWLASHFS